MINFTHPAGADQIRIEFVRNNNGQPYDGYNTPYTINDFSITRLDTIGRRPVAVCSGCHQDTLDMTELKASSDLESGVTFSGNDIRHNGVTWRPQASAIVSLYNQAIKVVNSGGSSEGVLALPSIALVEPNTTYIMECDILEVSPGITDIAFYAIDNTGAPNRVMTVEAGTGHRSIVFTTGPTLGTYLTFRASARPATAGLYFVVDNFVFRKYKSVTQTTHYSTDFSEAVMSGVDVYNQGKLFRAWTTSTTSLSIVGSADKKIEVSAGTVNESRLRVDVPAIGGIPYLVKFSLGQPVADKRVYIELLYRSGGGGWTTAYQGLFFTGSGDYLLNFTLPAGADELRVGWLRNNTGSSFDGLGVPYTIDNFSITHIAPQEQLAVTVCDPPPGGNTGGLYRFGFNGAEKDNEIKGTGNSYDFLFRMYDSRLGRFLSTDPLTQKFPALSPYQHTGNNPIAAIDLEGLEPATINPNTQMLVLVLQGYGGDPNNGATQAQNAGGGLDIDNTGLGQIQQAASGATQIQVVTFASSTTNNTKNDVKKSIEAFKAQNSGGQVVLVGHSQGADNIVELAKENKNLNIDLMITLDIKDASNMGVFSIDDDNIPSNVKYAINYYQLGEFIGGEKIEIDNKKKTQGINILSPGSNHRSIDNDVVPYVIQDINNLMQGKNPVKEAKGRTMPTFNPADTNSPDVTGKSKSTK